MIAGPPLMGVARRLRTPRFLATLLIAGLAWVLMPATTLADNCPGMDEVGACAKLAFDSGFLMGAAGLLAAGWAFNSATGRGAPPGPPIPPDEEAEEGDGDEPGGAPPGPPIPPDEEAEEGDGDEPGGAPPGPPIPPDEDAEEGDGFQDSDRQEEE